NGKTRMSLIIWEPSQVGFLVFIDAEIDRYLTNRVDDAQTSSSFRADFSYQFTYSASLYSSQNKTDIPDSTLVYPKLPKFTTKKKLFSKIFTTFPPLLSNTEFQLSPSKGLIGLSKKER
ncbi:MAG: hypothetical protein IIW01_00020, partial [Thermoguttaceae bacterium]|nr:hypothetical protein [Thermoguttaceae bacterium]